MSRGDAAILVLGRIFWCSPYNIVVDSGKYAEVAMSGEELKNTEKDWVRER